MKAIIFAIGISALSGCSTPNRNPSATDAAYEQLKGGMTREQVYALLGQPKSVQPPGDIAHCQTATWSIPHNSHGWGHFTITFDGDGVVGINYARATISF